jgi:hypothetical protein
MSNRLPQLYSNNRQSVAVQHALSKRDNLGLLVLPYYNDLAILNYTKIGKVPVGELQYWLSWCNLPTQELGEKTHDLPTAIAILNFVQATLTRYTKVPEGKMEHYLKIPQSELTAQTVPIEDLRMFLNQFRTDGTFTVSKSQEDRERVIRALDEFVGTYL